MKTIATVVLWAVVVFYSGAFGYILGAPEKEPTPPMSLTRATIYSTEIAKRLTQCWGEPKEGVYYCRPLGPKAQSETTELLHPVITCRDGYCKMVTP